MSFYSTYWYRVADIKPRLRPHVRLFRHIYRGQNWYVMQDPSSNRLHRFSEAAYHIIGLMDGKKSVQEIWNGAHTTLGDDAPTQDEMIRLLAQLHFADVLQSNIPPDSVELFERQRRQRTKWKQRLNNPLAVRFPLVDPDRFLVRWLFLAKVLCSRIAILVWILVTGTAFVLAGVHWQELTHNVVDRVLQPENLLILWLVYPVIKLLHELGHALLVRHWGGEVHEMGIMLLAFTPVPYVDASSSAVFPDKKKRVAVAATGMAIELFIASVALFLWLNVESGLLSTVAYNVVLIGSLSTLAFNGNPLLRFDGYYVLSDMIEIPNLAKRSTEYLGYLVKRYFFGVGDSNSPVTSPGERGWFISYGALSFFYRLFIIGVLALMIIERFFIVGALIAVWAIWSQVISPVAKNSITFLNSTSGRKKRSRIIGIASSAGIGLGVLLFVVPAPLRTKAQGVVSLPEQSRVRAGTDCFIVEVYVKENAWVHNGEPLFRCEDPLLDAEVRVLAADYEEAYARHIGVPLQARVKRDILKEKMNAVHADLTHATERKMKLVVASPNKGLFVLPESSNIKGRFVRQGELIGYIVGESDPTVVVVIEQGDIGLVRERTRDVRLRFAGDIGKTLTTKITREIPAANEHLPSPVLGVRGGGDITVNPADPEGVQTFKKTFRVEIKVPLEIEEVRIGERVYALFDHGYEPLAIQWYRMLRKLFLRHLHV